MRTMSARTRRRAAVAAAIAVVVTACGHTVGGVAEPARVTVSASEGGYGFADDRCGLLDDDSLRELLRASSVVKTFAGAVCQYVVSTDAGALDVVFTWFVRGTVDRERDVAVGRGARVRDVVVARQPAFVAQRPSAPNACAATAAAGAGAVTWWVQFRQRSGDACAHAETLLTATLSADT